MLDISIEDFYNKFDFKANFLLSEGGFNKELDKLFETIYFKKGDKLFYEDGIPTGVFLLVEGKAKKYKTILNNREQIFYMYKQGDLMGYHALLSEERYQDSCELIEPSTLKFLSRENFLWLIEEYPEVKMKITANIAHEFGVLANIIGVLAQESQDARLAVNLLILENRYRESDGDGVRISRTDLANIVGTSIESLARNIRSLKNQGLISVEGKVIFILDKEKLFEFVYK